MNQLARLRTIGFAIAAFVFALDQGIKHWVTKVAHLQYNPAVEIAPIFRMTYTENHGVSLGFLRADSAEMRLALIALTAAIALVVLVWLWRERKLGEIAALGLVLGGALGNIRDRAMFGFVIDWADLHFGEWRPFLIFNLADAAITVGVLIILARSLLMREKPAQPNDAVNAAPET